MPCFVFRFILSLCEVAIVAIYSDHDWWPIWYFLNHVFPLFSSCFLIFSSFSPPVFFIFPPPFPVIFFPRYLQRPRLVANMVLPQSCFPLFFLLFSHIILLFSFEFSSTLSTATTIGGQYGIFSIMFSSSFPPVFSCFPPFFPLFFHIFLLFSCNFFSTLSRATTIGITIWYIFLFSIWYVFLFFQSGIFFFLFNLVYFFFFSIWYIFLFSPFNLVYISFLFIYVFMFSSSNFLNWFDIRQN